MPCDVTIHARTSTVLIVDDDEPTQNLLRAVLRRCGFVTDVASNGGQAIAMLEERQYAAVILDVMMPMMGGREVVAFLGESRLLVPVMICSAAGPAALTGFDPQIVKAIIRKPFDIDQLVATLTGIVNDR